MGGPAAPPPSSGYPISAGLEAPITIARWRPLVHWLLIIPQLIFVYVLGIVSEVLVVIAWFAALFTGRVPTGLADFIAGYHRQAWRVQSYALFLRESYPSFSFPSGYADPGGDPAWLQIVPPERLSRLAVFFRFILAIPLYLWGIVLGLAIYVVVIVAFFAVLITGRWPEGLRTFTINVMQWNLRVQGWGSLLADPYPPFALS